MTPGCPAPDPAVGIAVRLSAYLDCQARVLGENGYLSLATGPVGTGLLTACLGMLVALIGYRLILGSRPQLHEGIGWTFRVGIALALLGSWPAFETLIYRVVTDGPGELASTVLPASGLPSDDLPERVQMAYDTIRLGAGPTSPSTDDASRGEQRFQFEGAAPKTAVLFLVMTIGLVGALRVAIGFLLAVGPLPLLSMILSGRRGLLLGWVRILAGLALAIVAVTTTTSVEIVLVESELGRLQAFRTSAGGELVDPQALAVIVFTGLAMTLIAAVAAVRIASRLDFGSFVVAPQPSSPGRVRDSSQSFASPGRVMELAPVYAASAREREMVHSLTMMTRRELDRSPRVLGSATAHEEASPAGDGPSLVTRQISGRRRTVHRTRSHMRRESR